jgi:putative ABC transport system substrate-binding protein
MARIGVLMHATESDPATTASVVAFMKALRELGWIEGRDLQIDHRYSDFSPGRLANFAKELAAMSPDAIFARGTPPALALLKETRNVPIVFVEASDPVGSGFAASLARPGGNVTGFTNFEASMATKWLELLREIAPAASRRVAVIFNPATAVDAGRFFLRPIEDAARSIQIDIAPMPVHDVSEIGQAMDAFVRNSGGGLVSIPDLFNSLHRHQIIAHATARGFPAVFSTRQYAQSGGLIAYGVDAPDLSRRAAGYVDRILRGTKAGDLPVQAPTKFELVINLKTAKALGLNVPPTLVARADEVIE